MDKNEIEIEISPNFAFILIAVQYINGLDGKGD